MYETEAELRDLQDLLDRSIDGSGGHLRSIIEPGRRTMSAASVVSACTDVCLLNLATTTSAGEPRLSAVDGHFLHGRWHFSTAASALKARHMRARPAVSAAWTPRDGLGVWVHGRVAFLEPGTAPWRDLDRHLTLMYDQSPSEWSDSDAIVYLRLDPQWMVGFAMTADEQREMDAALERRRQRLANPVTKET